MTEDWSLRRALVYDWLLCRALLLLLGTGDLCGTLGERRGQHLRDHDHVKEGQKLLWRCLQGVYGEENISRNLRELDQSSQPPPRRPPTQPTPQAPHHTLPSPSSKAWMGGFCRHPSSF